MRNIHVCMVIKFSKDAPHGTRGSMHLSVFVQSTYWTLPPHAPQAAETIAVCCARLLQLHHDGKMAGLHQHW